MPRLFQVLLVEDDDPLRDVLVEVISRRGWAVHPAAEAAEALELARRVRIDFSLLDLHLPDLTGLDLLTRLRREMRALPSIMMSGAASQAEFEAARRAGVFQFLQKPLELVRLERTLDELVRTYFGSALGSPLPMLPPPTDGPSDGGPDRRDTRA
jgi:DNA-binding response OmpR family regulator